MPVQVIDILKQKNELDFPIVDSNDIKGGYYQVETMSDRDSIPQSRRKNGMLCHVYQIDKIYKLIDSEWIPFETGGSGGGNHTGPQPPKDTDLIWFDNSSKKVSKTFAENLILELTQIVSSIKVKLDDLEGRVKYLELNGGGINPPPLPDEEYVLLLEDGSSLLFEDGSNILLEIQKEISEAILLLENGYNMLFEDGTNIELE